jgi:hypothetical protein
VPAGLVQRDVSRPPPRQQAQPARGSVRRARQ